MVGSLADNLALLRRAFEEGKIGAVEVLLLRREFIESPRLPAFYDRFLISSTPSTASVA